MIVRRILLAALLTCGAACAHEGPTSGAEMGHRNATETNVSRGACVGDAGDAGNPDASRDAGPCTVEDGGLIACTTDADCKGKGTCNTKGVCVVVSQ